MIEKERYYTLDLIRGIAALLVMWMHYSENTIYDIIPGSWMAVDLFFILSGFVVTFSVEVSRVNLGNGFRFITHRIIRLYPLYFIGLVSGGLCYAALILNGMQSATSISDLSKNFVLGAFLLPNIWNTIPDIALSANSIYPLNAPSWSIFFEVVVNIIFIPIYFSKILRKKTTLITFIILLIYIVHIGTVILLKSGNPGWGPNNFIYGFPRVFSEYGVGYLIYIHRNLIKGSGVFKNNLFFSTTVVLIIVFLALPNSTFRVFNFAMLPILVCFGISDRDYFFRRRIYALFGALSYPIYIIHIPVLYAAIVFAGSGATFNLVQRLILVLVVIALAFLLSRVEHIIRRHVERVVLPKATAINHLEPSSPNIQ